VFHNGASASGEELACQTNGLSKGMDGGSRMARLSALALTVTIVWMAPAAAESADQSTTSALPSLSRVGGAAPGQIDRRGGFAFPVVEYSEPNGVWQQRRGIIAGREIAPGTVLGLGIFQTAPKMRGYVGDMPQNLAPKRNRRAAVGISMKF
jgi:hypothetical protein